MRILITGSRDWQDANAIHWAIMSVICKTPGPHIVVHGDCRGADTLAAKVAADMGCAVEAHPADWRQHGNAAGPIRNHHMVSLGADICLAFPTYNSTGTWDCVRKAVDAGIHTRIFP